MANGQQQDPSTLPYEGASSDDEFLKQYGAAPGGPAGTVAAVQPPQAANWMPTTASGWVNRYAKAGAEGMAWQAPVVAGELAAAPFTGGATAAMIPETAALGFTGGVVGQGAEDVWRGATGEEPPWWVGPAASTVGSLGIGGLPAAGRAIRAGAGTLSNMAHGGGFLSGLIGGGIADQIMHNATHIITSMSAGGAAGLGLGAGLLSSARQMARPTLRSWLRPVTGALAGGVVPNAANALSPSDYNTP